MICVGGLVAGYRAGMAVPDWPATFGYWFYYPIQSWLAVWDVFLNHGHRTIGWLVGLLAIALAVVLWKKEPRKPIRWLGLAAVALVCVHGTLGGLRVLANEVWLANLHACTGPLVFVLTAALVTLTSPRWRSAGRAQPEPAARRLPVWSLVAVAVVYVQIVLGVQMRHMLPEAGVGWFVLWLWLHLINAGLMILVVGWMFFGGARRLAAHRTLVRRTGLLLALVVAQLALGPLAWISQYGWPVWAADYAFPLNYAVATSGPFQALVGSAHVALGSLTLAAAVAIMLWSRRLNQVSIQHPTSNIQHPKSLP